MNSLVVLIFRRHMGRLSWIFIFLLGIASSVMAQQEEILRYHTTIEVHTDRSITVTEDIDVRVAGDRIKRGLTRRLPTERTLNDKEIRVKYEILE